MLNKKIGSVFFTAFDFETTGLYPVNDRIIEIGAIKFNTVGEKFCFSGLINPKMKIPKKASEVNGIYDDMLKDKPEIEDILPGFLDFIDDTVLVAHNIGFDKAFLLASLKRSNIKTTDKLCIDTIDMAKKCFPGLYRYNLGNVCKCLNIDIENAHRAEDDALACMKVFEKSLKTIPNCNNMTFKAFFNYTGIKIRSLYQN